MPGSFFCYKMCTAYKYIWQYYKTYFSTSRLIKLCVIIMTLLGNHMMMVVGSRLYFMVILPVVHAQCLGQTSGGLLGDVNELFISCWFDEKQQYRVKFRTDLVYLFDFIKFCLPNWDVPGTLATNYRALCRSDF